jgi:hypothetical protein
MLSGSAMLDLAVPAIAVRPTSTQRGEEAVQHFAVQPTDGKLTEQRADVDPDAAFIPIPCSRLDVQHLQIAISSWLTVALVRGALRSSTWPSRRVRTFSAVAAALEPAGTVSVRKCFFFDTGSSPT